MCWFWLTYGVKICTVGSDGDSSGRGWGWMGTDALLRICARCMYVSVVMEPYVSDEILRFGSCRMVSKSVAVCLKQLLIERFGNGVC